MTQTHRLDFDHADDDTRPLRDRRQFAGASRTLDDLAGIVPEQHLTYP